MRFQYLFFFFADWVLCSVGQAVNGRGMKRTPSWARMSSYENLQVILITRALAFADSPADSPADNPAIVRQ